MEFTKSKRKKNYLLLFGSVIGAPKFGKSHLFDLFLSILQNREIGRNELKRWKLPNLSGKKFIYSSLVQLLVLQNLVNPIFLTCFCQFCKIEK
jgi:hypothetical protein